MARLLLRKALCRQSYPKVQPKRKKLNPKSASKRLVVYPFALAPKPFQMIEKPLIVVEDMHYYVAVIKYSPAAFLKPLSAPDLWMFSRPAT